MTVERWLLACMSVLMLTGMRNPFLPPEDRCQIAELSTWRFQGMVSQGTRPIGIVQDSQKKWRRVKPNDVLKNGWTITQITAQNITLGTEKNCEPPRRQWQRQGAVNEAMDSVDSNSADGRDNERTGDETAKRDAGGR
ncbi:HofP DNA utilization family protein [Citrobacter portucalensis]|uniref:HofP DNA utilization family protein n=1 Tax=Citrobacter portucalensis TaxID=1639133 RepID=UPI003983ADB6